MPQEIEIAPVSLEPFRLVLPPDRYDALEHTAHEARELLQGRVVWNINSTAQGGGVVELLRPLLGYARGAGLDARWMVIDGTPDFFTVTKRIHNRLHGALGDGGPLDEIARQVYESVLADNYAAIADRVREDDVVIVHDPQPAGMIPPLHALGAAMVWRCHVGTDTPNELAREAWGFLRPYLLDADAYVFSRRTFVWEGLDRHRIFFIAPSIDVFSPKNEDLAPETVHAVLQAIGVLPGEDLGPVTFRHHDGTPGRVERRAGLIPDEPLSPDVPVVLQVSRWDALKDPIGVIRGFAQHVPADLGAHLVYAAPAAEAVADDPEGARVIQESLAVRESLPDEPRRRVHFATLPMEDATENAVMVNALQRHARVIVQKSLAEGFGLTVAEAMWKARPVVASRIGGIQEQIIHDETGILLDDPRDLEAFGAAVTGLLVDPDRAEEMGRRARERVRDKFTSVRSLLDYFEVVRRILPPRP